MANKVAAPVWATKLPLALDDIDGKADALSTLFGRDTFLKQRDGYLVAYTLGQDCDCRSCFERLQHVIVTAGGNWMNEWMHVCPDCGSKRCGKSEKHWMMCDNDVKELLDDVHGEGDK